MTIIKATCPVCGDVQLSRDQVRLVLHPVRDRSFYSFMCTSCDDEVRKPAGPEVVRLLRMGGVLPENADFPAEAAEEHHGPALTRDDLLDFVQWLESATAVAAAAGSGPPRPPRGTPDPVAPQPRPTPARGAPPPPPNRLLPSRARPAGPDQPVLTR